MSALLQCGHTAYYDPEPSPGDEVYCRKCRGYTRVRIAEREYSWHCPTCHITRRHGADMDGARHSGRRHQRKCHHVVLLRKGYDTVEIIGPEGQGELSIAGERIEWVKGHQGALRALVDKHIVQNG